MSTFIRLIKAIYSLPGIVLLSQLICLAPGRASELPLSALLIKTASADLEKIPVVIPVTGRVTGEQGESIPGVSVVLKGTTRGTTTDVDGKFQIEVPDGNATLVFSFVGYATQEAVIGNRSTIDIKLLADENPLSEIVVVGYSTIKKNR